MYNSIRGGEEMEYLTTADVAETLKVNVETVRRWIRDNEISYVDIGKGYRISEDGLDQFIEKRKY